MLNIRILYAVLFAIFPILAIAQNWGDEVARCISQKMRASGLGSSEAVARFSATCGKEVDEARRIGSNKFKGPELLTQDQAVEIVRQQRLEQLSQNWKRCVFNHALELDDGVTAAGDIGEVVSVECIEEHKAIAELIVSAQNRAEFDKNRHAETKHLAIQSILMNRAHKAGRIK